jgi:hypothetical protein
MAQSDAWRDSRGMLSVGGPRCRAIVTVMQPADFHVTTILREHEQAGLPSGVSVLKAR